MATLTLDSLPTLLRDCLIRARAGEAITIVDHGRTVARVVPEPDIPVGFLKAAAEGGITLPAAGLRRASSKDFPPITGGGKPASQMVIEDRR
jgi:antitoxin (DNA-binding transcriptional repressor) of toxin-antitoxin stability system